MNTRLAFLGRKRQVIPFDGNCQFIVVACGLGKPDAAHIELRSEVVKYFINNRREFDEFQTVGSWDTYIEYISTVGVGWGDHLSLTVLTRLYHCEIQIVQDVSAPAFVQTITPPEIRIPGIVIVHYDEVHYESTVPI